MRRLSEEHRHEDLWPENSKASSHDGENQDCLPAGEAASSGLHLVILSQRLAVNLILTHLGMVPPTPGPTERCVGPPGPSTGTPLWVVEPLVGCHLSSEAVAVNTNWQLGDAGKLGGR